MNVAEIKEAAKRNKAARAVVLAVKSKLEELDSSADQASFEESAFEIISSVLDPPRLHDVSPPWTPPRYRLDPERSGVTKRFLLHDYGGSGEVKLYVTLNFYDDGTPSEMFVTKQSDASTVGSLLDALATCISIGLQHGVPWSKFSSKMVRTRFAPHGMTDEEDPELVYVSSVLDYVFRWADKRIQRNAR